MASTGKRSLLNDDDDSFKLFVCIHVFSHFC